MKNAKLKIKQHGVTLVELMVVVALMAIIFIPLVQIFKSFTNAWWAGKARMTVQAEARDAMYWFTKDMKSAYRHGVGNMIRNGGFDTPDSSPAQAPTGWDWIPANSGLPAGIVKISSPSTRGFCIGVSTWTTFSSTFTFQLQPNVDYILTGQITNTNGSQGRIQVTNPAGTTLYASTDTNHLWAGPPAYGWETVTADPNTAVAGTVDAGNSTFRVPSVVSCIIQLSNTAAGTPSIAYFENISVTPRMAVLV
ncbi:MAG TPA: hypothetical protein DCX95_06585, partial [Elusimicrobia bacterium]|nr:hypothetical protein [Elusimicrobiota bacterium]